MIDKKLFNKAKIHVAVTPAEAIKMIRELQDIS